MNSRFINNNQPINKSLYFNTIKSTYLSANQSYFLRTYPSIVIDNNNTVHVLCNVSSAYSDSFATVSVNNPPRVCHFLTTDDNSFITNKNVTAITDKDKPLSINNWNGIRDFILSDSPNSQTALYTLCFKVTNFDYWYVFKEN
jgi:hypothetical protein